MCYLDIIKCKIRTHIIFSIELPVPQVQIRFAPVQSHRNVPAPIISVKRVLCPISRLCFLKQYIGNHTYCYIGSLDLVIDNKTSVVA